MNSTIYIYFNNQTRKPAFLSAEPINGSALSLVREIEIEGTEFNLARYRWEGDYDTGRLVDLFLEKKSIVTEDEIDKKYYGMFFRKYPLEEVLFNIIQHVEFRELTPGWEMQVFLQRLLSKKDSEIKTYQNSPNHVYETKEDMKKREAESFKV
jgi:hypothetical protein